MGNFQRFLPLMCLLLAALCWPAAASQAQAALVEIPPTYQKVAENDVFRLYVDSATLAFKLLDKRSAYVWHSGIDELIEGDRLNTAWQAFAKSGLSIEYLDERGSSKRVSIANADHTLTVMPIEQGISAQVVFTGLGITVGVILHLEADGVRVEVPFESIHEQEPGFRLGRIYLYPFLGATRGSSVPGYMLLPDGTGSLIPFADSTRADNMFYGRYYGADLGMIAIMPYDPRVNSPYPISLPVYGMAHGEGQNAFWALVEKGAAYSELQVHPAGIITNFNFVYNAFIYNETYFQATNRSGAGVTTVQRQPNAFDVAVRYCFLTGDTADYIGMARSYRQYLIDGGRLHKNDDPNPNIGIRLEFLAGDKERILLWHRFVPMTTIQQMGDILAGLQIPNPEVIYYGWQPLGASTMPPTWLALEGSLGSLDELRALAERITADGGHFSLYLEPQAALWGEAGYSTRSDVAMSITNVGLEGYNRQYNYYFTFDALQRRYAALAQDIASQMAAGLALDGIGFTLYGDFRGGRPFNREAAIQAYQALLADSPLRLGIYRPNDYLFGLAQAYYDMPLGDNGYIYTARAVPFLPIVLAGYLPYYGPALNFSSNRQDDLLRHVEFGIYPSYFLTHEATSNMLNTPSAWIYTSSYAQWGEEIQHTYRWMNALLAPVRGQEIIAHYQLAEGVFATTYANGRQIVVNYTDKPFTHNGMTVEAKNALLLEVTS
ncbi:MAG: hypothetical protein DWB42_04290 [Chloroflexi bacterium]|nr:hypothetical protein [Chloroflexota bacterium]MDL1882653.1 hypothetical protein [Anaerolineae bacterium CFX8]